MVLTIPFNGQGGVRLHYSRIDGTDGRGTYVPLDGLDSLPWFQLDIGYGDIGGNARSAMMSPQPNRYRELERRVESASSTFQSLEIRLSMVACASGKSVKLSWV